MHAAPSEPSPQRTPASSHVRTLARPEPSFRFDPGQWTSAASARFQRRELAGLEPHAVRADEALAQHVVLVEVARGGRAHGGGDLARLGRALGEMGVDEQAPLARRRGDVAPQTLAARQDEARRERDVNPAVARLIEAPGERERIVERLARRLEQAARHALALVHQRLAEDRAQPALLHRRRRDVGPPHRAHVVDARDAAANQLEQSEPRRGRDRRLGVRGLERPDALAQPAQQVALLGEPAKQRLAQMEVTVDEAGQHETAARVDRRVGAAVRKRGERRRHGGA